MALKLALFIPVYNVEAHLDGVLRRIPETVWSQMQRIYIIDNVSSDRTLDVALEFARGHSVYPIQVFRNSRNGMLGGSTAMAFDRAIADGIDYLICLHGDGQAPPEALPEFISRCSEDRYDFILGSRLLPGSETGEYSRPRWLANLAFAYLQQAITKQKVYDLGAYIGFNMRFLRGFPYRALVPDMGYHPILILTACRLALSPPRFTEFPIHWGRVENSNINVMSYSLIHLMRLLGLYFMRPRRLDRNRVGDLRTELVHSNVTS